MEWKPFEIVTSWDVFLCVGPQILSVLQVSVMRKQEKQPSFGQWQSTEWFVAVNATVQVNSDVDD